MPYAPEHKQQTRQRILLAAGKLFRSYGFHGVSINQVMAEAGLTRGGFYAHFKSKVALFTEVVGSDYGLALKMRQAREGELRDTEGRQYRPAEALDYYLSPENREKIAQDCTLLSLTPDVRRVGAPANLAYDQNIAALMDEFSANGLSPDAAAQATALAVGSATLASAMNDEQQAAQILSAANARIQALLIEASS